MSIDIESIASKPYMNSKQLNRQMLYITGENTFTYITHIRLGKAKRLLHSPEELPIAEIAMRCSFGNCACFSRIFKKSLNMTPSQYRKRVKE